MFVVVSTILWATFSHIEVVAVAPGRLMPVGNAKNIQPSEPGIVREIAVREGQYVKEGQLLLSLDPTTSQADETNLNQRMISLQCELALFDALLTWDVNQPSELPKAVLPEGTSKTIVKLYDERLKSEILVLIKSLDKLTSDLKRFDAQTERTKTAFKKFDDVLTIDKELSATYLTMYKKSVSSRTQWLSFEQQRIRTEQDKAACTEQLEEIAAARSGVQLEMAVTTATFRSEIFRKKADAESELTSVMQELAKANRRNVLKHLYSPVSGYVQQVAVHTIGGVVQSAETVMVIVPDDVNLELKANVLNKDIGFISPGQKVSIKVEAFPFTEYGMAEGKIETISADAIESQDGELLYPCVISLEQNNIVLDGKKAVLRPGMRATAEIVLRQRSLISYFLSPLLKHAKESLRER